MTTVFNDAVFDHLMATVPAGAPVSGQRLAQPEIPRPIGHFLGLTLERRLRLKASDINGIAAGWVDYHSSEVTAGVEAFLDVLVANAQFPEDEWPRALRQAVERVVDHMVRPVATLVHFLFADETGPVRREDLLRRARYFIAHPYLGTTAEALLARTGSAPVERRELSEALERVERSVTSEWSTDDWIRALNPLLDLARTSGLDGVPLEMLEAFFQDKNAPLRAARLHAYGKRKKRDALDQGDVRAALTDETLGPAMDEEPARKNDAGSDEPLWRQFRPDSESATGEHFAPASGEPLWKRFREPSAVDDQPAALHVLEQDVLGEAGIGREAFVRELFSGSEEEYGRLLGRLRAATSWAAASGILGEDLFRKNRIDIYSPAAVDFTNAVEKRYRRES